MSDNGMVRTVAAILGVALVGAGLLGFVGNPIVGPGPNNNGTDVLFAANSVHNIVHLVTGALALYIAFGLSGAQQANGLLGFGILYVAIFVAVLISPTLFGLFDPIPANLPLHLLHAALAVVGIGVGYMARGSTSTMTTR
ncbi:MAG: DUF4383 domain-containing protein [Chloroflexota bacterium]|nr:DUF4383 domain-containing protein [Chloroflexota bacterium]